MECPLCKFPKCSNQVPDGNYTVYACMNCGQFTLTPQAFGEMGDNCWKLASYSLRQNYKGVPPVFYSAQKFVPLNASAGSVGIDVAVEAFPKTVADRLDVALLNLSAATKHLGQPIYIDSRGANPLLLAQNTAEAFFVLQGFELEGYVVGKTTSLPTEIILTAKGMNRVADLERGLFGPANKQVFVAMSFDQSLDSAWLEGIKPGIEDCNYDPLRVDRKQHNEKICDVIIAEIRKSKFLVADFTLHRNGVYFEAGMMMGLGRPIIYTCRNTDIDKAHFDTRQYNHIIWETPSELREKLKNRVQATIAQ